MVRQSHPFQCLCEKVAVILRRFLQFLHGLKVQAQHSPSDKQATIEIVYCYSIKENIKPVVISTNVQLANK